MTTNIATNIATHTPGPWLYDVSSGFPIHIYDNSGDGALEICRIGGSPICPESSEECDANARLIAAAPELLAALESMVDMFERHIDGRPGPDDAAARWDDARAAIAKARGE